MRRAVALGLAVLLATGHVAAQAPRDDALMRDRSSIASKPDDAAAAQVLFREARGLMQEGKYAEACPKLEESQRLDGGMGTLYNLADCYEHTGRLASAWARFVDVAGLARQENRTSREEDARQRAAHLEPRLSRLTIVVAHPLAGLEVARDGVTLGSALWGQSFPIDAGRHVVSARAPGRLPWERAVEIGGDGQTAMVNVPALAPAPVRSPAAGDDGSATSSGGGLGKQRVLALAAGGLGVVGVGIGSAFGLVSLSKKNEADSHCSPANGCDASAPPLRDDAFSAGTVSTVAFAVGLVALAGGVVLWLTAPTTPRDRSQAVLTW